ncbi:hypothetical protein ACMD2_27144 [Ananas comosus]|uniref:Uncharacterized protein n=1 Tax=Ananas comosus TaxID=4615 RepID=A0A199VK28_ANACO|nr:hypothetical protein ACMD2_27144 [Ananas comosus]
MEQHQHPLKQMQILLNDQPSATGRQSCPPGPIDRMGHHVNKSTNQVVARSYTDKVYSTPTHDTTPGNNSIE